jgi:hypothetical protein
MTQMVLAEDDEMIEAFPLDREDPALGVSVQVRRSWTDLDDVALLAGQDGVELGGEFGVEVVNQVRGPIRLLLGEEHEVPGLLATQRASGCSVMPVTITRNEPTWRKKVERCGA